MPKNIHGACRGKATSIAPIRHIGSVSGRHRESVAVPSIRGYFFSTRRAIRREICEPAQSPAETGELHVLLNARPMSVA